MEKKSSNSFALKIKYIESLIQFPFKTVALFSIKNAVDFMYLVNVDMHLWIQMICWDSFGFFLTIWESSIPKTLIYYHLEYSRYDFHYFVAFELWIHWIFFLDYTTEYTVGSRMKWINIIKFEIATFKQKNLYTYITGCW